MTHCPLLTELRLATILAPATAATKPNGGALALGNVKFVEAKQDSATSPKCLRARFTDRVRMTVAMNSKVASSIMGVGAEELIVQTESGYRTIGFHEIPLATRARYGLFTSVMSSFDVRLRHSDDNPLMRAFDYFQLINDGERWRIVSHIDVVEKASSPLQAAFQPSGSREDAR